MSEPFCQPLREALLQSAESIGAKTHDGGTYVCMEGPQFSTRAEALMHRAWGGDLIGMTCVPEVKLAREAEMCYALVALPTDYDCWRPHPPGADKATLLSEIVSNMQHASEAAIALVEAVIKRLGTEPLNDCSCQNALELAIWSDKSAVDAATIERLQPLIGRYFPEDR
jgi:5'-methylthioadenosine phosphorylase